MAAPRVAPCSIAPFLFLLLVAASCTKKEASPVDADAEADAGDKDEAVRAVYPKSDSAPADPLATRLCKALHDLPEAKRAACCNEQPGLVFTSECVRTLSTALRDKAVTVAAADVVACETEIQKTFDGCEWVGPFPPGPPAACLGIVHGTVQKGDACRSSLECAAPLRCQGAGPTTLGKCFGTKSDGVLCGSSVDTLASYTRQTDVDQQHPECTGFCNRNECASFVAEGGGCTTSTACGAGNQCVANKCVKMAASKIGDACPGQVCEPGSACIANKCAAKKRAGETCAQDFECLGGCIKSLPDGGSSAHGVCGTKCGVR
jgi:hypothetical protein